MDTYLTRLTWNQDRWQRPSGALGKREQGTYVVRQGFGHEEWLNRREWVLNGWRYGFVQGVNKSQQRLEGEQINLIFYTFMPNTEGESERVYVGEMRRAEVLSEGLAETARINSVKKGWIRQMKREVASAGGKPRVLDVFTDSPLEFANIRFRPDDLKIFGSPVPVPPGSRVYKFSRYQLFKATGRDTKTFRGHTRRAALQRRRSEGPVRRKAVRETVMQQLEMKMQRQIAEILERQFGKVNVKREENYADILVRGGRHLVIEVKADKVARRAIRNALGQLLFYGYHDGCPSPRPELIVVGRGSLGSGDELFLRTLREVFGLAVAYQQYRLDSGQLSL